MFDKFNDGYCSQCKLAGNDIPMRLNHDDFWECPHCNLQGIGGGQFTIRRIRGTSDFLDSELYATSYLSGVLTFTEDLEDECHPGDVIMNEADLRVYLENEVRESKKV